MLQIQSEYKYSQPFVFINKVLLEYNYDYLFVFGVFTVFAITGLSSYDMSIWAANPNPKYYLALYGGKYEPLVVNELCLLRSIRWLPGKELCWPQPRLFAQGNSLDLQGPCNICLSY